MSEGWVDGVCKKCGSPVFETVLGAEDNGKEAEFADYKNKCTNPNCEEGSWHYVADLEQLEYYDNEVVEACLLSKEEVPTYSNRGVVKL